MVLKHLNPLSCPSPVRIGNAQAFWGDSPAAPARLVLQQPDLNFLTLDYLSEVSMSIMAAQREKDPSLGYAADFLDVVSSLLPHWQKGSKVKIVTNAGGLHPQACGKACQELLKNSECAHLKIGIVTGDDVADIFRFQENPLFDNLETGESLLKIKSQLVTANAYLGAKPIVEALLKGADIVITGRVADPSLTVGACLAHYGWAWDDYDRLAGATIAGHLIECSTQVTGGISTNWLELPDPAYIGFPVAEIYPDGSCIITKPAQTGGLVNIAIVKEQLLYEIGDPSNYLSPDVTVSFLALQLKEVGANRVEVRGAKGKAPPNTYKVSATYRDGFKAEAMLTIFGRDAQKKAQRCGEIILERLRAANFALERSNIECLGCGAVVPNVLLVEPACLECVLRICVADSRKIALECFAKEVASLVTSGPQGLTGYTSGRPHIRPVFGYWPALIEVEHVNALVEILEDNKIENGL